MSGRMPNGTKISDEALATADRVISTSNMTPVNPYSKNPYSKRRAEDGAEAVGITTVMRPSNPYAKRPAATARKAPQDAAQAQSKYRRPHTEPRLSHRPPIPGE